MLILTESPKVHVLHEISTKCWTDWESSRLQDKLTGVWRLQVNGKQLTQSWTTRFVNSPWDPTGTVRHCYLPGSTSSGASSASGSIVATQ